MHKRSHNTTQQQPQQQQQKQKLRINNSNNNNNNNTMGLGFLRTKSQLRIVSIANALSYLFMITFNVLSSTRGWNGGETNASVSGKYDTL